MPVQTKLQFRRGTAAAWTSANPVLNDGEPGYETDTKRVKYGNGTSNWASLPYFTLAGADITGTGKSATTFLRGDGTWVVPTNTTYSTATQAEIENAASTTARLISGQRMSQGVLKYAPVRTVAGRTGDIVLDTADITGLQDAIDAAGGLPAGGSSTTFLRGDLSWQPVENPVRSFSELQAAVAAGGTIRVDNNFPITMTATVDITVPCHIIGGKFIHPTDAAYNCFNVTSSDVTFDTCRFDGAGTAASSPVLNTRFIDVTGTSAAPVRNIRVRSCTMNGSQYENVRLTWVVHSSVTDCEMDDFRYAGVMIISGSDIKVIGNTITNGILMSPLVNVYGVACTDVDNTIAARCKNVTIVGNTIRHIEWEGIDTHGGLNLVISDNIVTGCNRGIALVVGNASRVTAPTNNIVTGNFIDLDDAIVTREGICLFGLSGLLADATITGNIIRGYPEDNGLYLDGYVDHKRTLIENNTFPHRKWTPIVMNNTASWTANATYVPEYMVEGKTVHIRGMAISATTSTANSRIGAIPASFAPETTTFVKASLGSNAAASSNVIAVLSNGEVWSYYKRAGDMYSYPLESSYVRSIDIT